MMDKQRKSDTPTLLRSTAYFILLLLCSFSVSAKSFTQVQWVELIPKSDLDALLNPPESLYNIPDGSAEDFISSDPLANTIESAISVSKAPLTQAEQAYYAALQSTNINPALTDKDIRIPGFIVPIEYGDDQLITEFFLVPYFGACIHVPPPPPNQIVYVHYPKGLSLDALYDPFWIEGRLQTEVIENDLAVSAYTLTAEAVKPYEEYAE